MGLGANLSAGRSGLRLNPIPLWLTKRGLQACPKARYVTGARKVDDDQGIKKVRHGNHRHRERGRHSPWYSGATSKVRLSSAKSTTPRACRRCAAGRRDFPVSPGSSSVSSCRLRVPAPLWARCEQVIKPMSAKTIASLDDEALRSAGLSRPKIRTMRSVSTAVLNGNLRISRLGSQSDADIHAAMTAVPGIGPWTADIFLLACLGRPDAFAAGDLALQVAAQHAFELDQRPERHRTARTCRNVAAVARRVSAATVVLLSARREPQLRHAAVTKLVELAAAARRTNVYWTRALQGCRKHELCLGLGFSHEPDHQGLRIGGGRGPRTARCRSRGAQGRADRAAGGNPEAANPHS